MVDYPNIFANGMAAYDAQTQRLQQATDYRAQRQAGTSIANNDYAGAAAALGGAGDLKAQQGVIQAGQAQQSRTAQIAGANAFANGDTQGAITALAPTGDIQTQSALHEKQIADFQRQATFTQQAATRLAAVRAQAKASGAPDGGTGAVLQAFDALAPTMRAMGSKDPDIAGLRQSLQQNPDAVLSALAAPPEYSFNVAGDTLFVTNKATGQKVGQFTGDKFVPVGPGQTLLQVGGEGGGGAPTAPAAPTAPEPAPGGDTRGVRNNNPLNLTTLPQGQWNGQTGADGRFAVFSSPEAGMAAADKNLQSYAKNHGIDTLQGIINRWAPTGDGANSPQAYAATVAKDIGIDPNQKLDLSNPQIRATILHSMSKVELGGSGSATQLAASAPAAAPQAQAAPQAAGGGRVVFQGKPEWQSDGKGNLVNAATGDRKVDPTVNGFGGAVIGTDLKGEDFLKSLPGPMQQTVKAIAEGRMPLPSGFVLKTPYGQQLIAAVGQYDPSFSAANAATRIATRKDFTSGKSAQTLTAFNTALAHLSNLDQAITGLNNTGLPINNQAAHLIAGVTGTDSRLETFEAVKRTAMDEVNKALVGGGGALGDREALMARMDASKNPATLHAVVGEVADLLQGKISAMGQQYTQGMGTDAYPIQLITPAAQRTIDRLSGRASGRTAAPAAAPTAGAWGKVVVH